MPRARTVPHPHRGPATADGCGSGYCSRAMFTRARRLPILAALSLLLLAAINGSEADEAVVSMEPSAAELEQLEMLGYVDFAATPAEPGA